MPGLVRLHLTHQGPGRQVIGRQPLKVALQVRLDLPFGFDHKAQADPIPAQLARCKADGKGAGVPQRVEPAGAIAQFAQALLGPGQVIGLFGAGGQQVLAPEVNEATVRLLTRHGIEVVNVFRWPSHVLHVEARLGHHLVDGDP